MKSENKTEKYSLYRDEVVSVLNELEVVAKKYPDYFASQSGGITAYAAINNLAKRYKENQFKLTLCGVFQGGKSTTVNVLCGGREISPMGIGLKTSACLVEIQNLDDANSDEYAEIFWRTNSEIVEGFEEQFEDDFIEFVKRNEDLKEILPENHERVLMSSWFKFSDKRHLSALKKFVKQEKEKRDSDTIHYPEKQCDILKYLKIVCDHINDKEIAECLKSGKTKCSLNEVKQAMVFPEKFSSKWNFEVEESKYAFVKKVRFHLKSSELGRLGCCLIDAPGLFISAWDDKVTSDAIENSDAVLFLIESQKEIDGKTFETLGKIIERKGDDNSSIFVLLNLRGVEECNIQKIVDATKARLLKYQFSGDKIPAYNAKLALLTLQEQFKCKDFTRVSSLYDSVSDKILENPKEHKEDLLRISGFKQAQENVETFIVEEKGGKALKNGIR